MKGGIAAFVEALRALRDTGALTKGAILLTAHDHHEAPWGDRRQLLALIREGFIGDGVLLPEYLGDALPVAGRGMAVFSVEIERDGEPVHEVLRPAGLPDVIAAGAEVVLRLNALNEHLRERTSPYIGSDTLFIGRVEGGQIYNQMPVQCRMSKGLAAGWRPARSQPHAAKWRVVTRRSSCGKRYPHPARRLEHARRCVCGRSEQSTSGCVPVCSRTGDRGTVALGW